jgi:hypothetical protein
MKKTLQDQYLLIKEGKGHKGVFLTEAKRQFPNIVRNAATFEEATASLITKNIITENVIGLTGINSPFEPKKKESYELAYEAFLAEAKKKENEDEKVKAEEKKVSKPVEKDLSHNFDRKDEKNPDNLIFDQIMTGYYAEMKDPKNADKTMQELKDIVFKNLAKDPIFYTKEGQFGVKDLGYTMDVPGLGEPKEAKGKYKASGYGDLNESKLTLSGTDKAIKMLKSELKTNKVEFETEGNKVIVDDSPKTKMAIKMVKERTGMQSLKLNESNQPLNEEVKLRKVIREIINEELEEVMYQGPSIKTSNTGGGGKRYTPNEVFFSQEAIDKFNFSNPGENAPTRAESLQIPHIKIFLSKETGKPIMKISDFLYNALQGLERGRTSREKEIDKNELEKEISNINPAVRALIKKKADPKMAFGNYHDVNIPFEYEKGVGIKIPLNKAEKEELEEMILRESLLKEGVEKDLMAINKEAEHEVLQSKMDKIQALIDKKQSQLSKLDEDEDMKSLTDDKKVKEISKDIKALEKAKAKLEKIMGKVKGKGKRKEIIDETEEELADKYVEDADERQDEGEKIDSTLSNYPNISLDDRNALRNHLEDRKENY